MIEEIHESFMNGQNKQAVGMIDDYSNDFWEDYKAYLDESYSGFEAKFHYYTKATIAYHKIN